MSPLEVFVLLNVEPPYAIIVCAPCIRLRRTFECTLLVFLLPAPRVNLLARTPALLFTLALALFLLDSEMTMKFRLLRARPLVEELRICYNSDQTFQDLPFRPL
ncbi:unnamed protein product [Sphagnum balticum]